MLPVISIVGRPNVGKSTLFNCLTKTRDALVIDLPGTTRDRKYGAGKIGNKPYIVIDTGGIGDEIDAIDNLMASQSWHAIEESDLVLFVVDARVGVTTQDEKVARLLRPKNKHVILVINKIDGLHEQIATAEFFKLGFQNLSAIAASQRKGITQLADKFLAHLQVTDDASKPSDVLLASDQITNSNNDSDNHDIDNHDSDNNSKSYSEIDGANIEDTDISDTDIEDTNIYDSDLDSLDDNLDMDDIDIDDIDDIDGDYIDDDNNTDIKTDINHSNSNDGIRYNDSNSTITSNSDNNIDLELGIKIAIIGKPNVGKSTLVNRILGEERVIVFDAPGTTRDSIYIPFERRAKKYTIIDTAGVRKRGKITDLVEKFSVVKALQAIENCNVALVVIDAREGVSDQDLSLLEFAVDTGRSVVIAINKWDGMDIEQKEEIKKTLSYKLEFVSFAKKHFISALHGSGVGDLFDSINKAYVSATKKHSTSLVTEILQKLVLQCQPPMVQGRRIKLRYAHAGGYNPPRIIIHGNQTDKIPDSYKRYLINSFIRVLKLEGTPIKIEFKMGENPYKGKHNPLTLRQQRKRHRLVKYRKKNKK